MLKDTNSEPAVPAPSPRKMASAAMTLVQAAALAAVLVPLGSVPAEATSLSCTYTAIGSGAASYSCPTGPEGGALFQYPAAGSSSPDIAYVVELGFDHVNDGSQFDVVIKDLAISQNDLDPQLGAFAGATCIPINPGNTAAPCVEFQVTQEPPADAWDHSGSGLTPPGYFLWIYWLAATDPPFSDPHILHATGTSDVFDSDITIPGSYRTQPQSCVFDPRGCGFIIGGIDSIPGDPAIGGRDNDFTLFTVVSPTEVPEPVSLLLVGSGVSGLIYRRRQQSRKSGTPNS
jgi:hypothetical protein